MTEPAHGREADDEVLLALVERALAAGPDADVEQICAAHPALGSAVREAVAIAASMPGRDAADPFPGTELGGRYRVHERIGAGAMGAVYRAVDRELGRDVAVKILQPALFDSPVAEARFLREAELLAALDHPAIVAVFDRGRTATGLLYLVMELVEGVSLAAVAARAGELGRDGAIPAAFADSQWLRDLLDAGPTEGYLRSASRWCQQLAEALGSAHARGICHRDVKPSNVRIARDGHAVLLDFGIARRRGDARLTLTQQALGTPSYMAPETALGTGEPGPAQDVYSLCATLWHLLAGRPPYEGDPARVVARIAAEDPPPLQSLHAGLPRDLAAIVERGLERDPRRRYADGAELARDLAAFLDHRPVAARPLSAFARRWRRVRRRPAKALLGVAAVLLALAAATGWWAIAADARAAQSARAEEQRALIASLPALLAIEGDASQRLLEDLGERGASIAVLDRILELGEDAPARLLRAALRLDNGEHARAADDLARLARDGASDYLRAVAGRYASSDSSVRGVDAVNLGGLPEPSTAIDKFVAGFHALRSKDVKAFARADALLAEAGASYVPARDLRLLTLLGLGRFQEVYDEAHVLVGLHGKTARTQHAIGAACIGLRRFRDAIEPLREAIALRPGRHGPLHNLGTALYDVGDLEGAERYLLEAHRVRPWMANTIHSLARLRIAQDRFDEAEALIASMPDEADPALRFRKPYLRGHLEIQIALARIARGDAEAARASAGAACASFDEAGSLGGPAGNVASSRAYARALAIGEWESALQHFLQRAGSQATNPEQIVNLATLLREAPLSAQSAAMLRDFALRQAELLGPGKFDYEKLRAELSGR